jgi:FAD/FMN-containing dehydrogenase
VLRSSHRALTVYPTSAPRATVGGWIARDGMGVGSFAYGWLRENIISAEVILPGGRLRTLEGDDLGLVVGAMGRTGVIVRATLKLRKTEMIRPFAIAFARREALQRAIDSLLERRPPLWHLGIVNPPMARDAIAREVLDLRRLLCERSSCGRGRACKGVEVVSWQSARCRPGIQDVGREVLPSRPRQANAGSR